jgi:AbrB family looped-hinge helix DNA binding protein
MLSKEPDGTREPRAVLRSGDGERGQIAVPADARRDFNIRLGDRLLVFGDLHQSIAFAPFDILRKTTRGAMGFLREARPAVLDKQTPRSKKR